MSRPPDSVQMIASLESETPQNAERGIETGIPFEVDSRISNGKRYDSIGSAAAHEVRAQPRDGGRGTFDWGVSRKSPWIWQGNCLLGIQSTS
jgi:hypothetical protein